MKNRLVYFLPVAAVFAGVVWAANLSTDYDHKIDFGRYHTYSWLGVKAGNSLWQDRISEAVDGQLAAKGWTKVASGGDATVSAFGRTTEQDTLQTYYDGFPGWGWRRGWGGGMGIGMATTDVVPEKVGNLTVDVFDAGTKQLIWRGQASEVISSNKPEKNDKKLDHTVEDMFKKFPPNGKG